MLRKSAKKERIIRNYSKKLFLFLKVLSFALVVFILFRIFEDKKYDIDEKLNSLSKIAGFNLEKVIIKGAINVTKKEIIQNLYTKEDEYIIGMSLYDFSLKEIKQKIQQIPWVKSVSLKRILPNTLIIEIEEKSAFALWMIDNEKFLIDETGTILSKVEEISLNTMKNLPFVFGKGANESLNNLVKELKDQPELFSQITAFEFVSGRRWNVYLKNKIQVKLPQQNVSDAWKRLEKIQKRDEILDRNIKYIDLRVQDRIFIGEK